MNYRDPMTKKISLTSKAHMIPTSPRNMPEQEGDIANMMMDARYLRQSSSLIQEALQKGFDVLQLSNGDIVMTGTKTVVYQYSWDEDKGKLAKLKADAPKKSKKSSDTLDMEEEESEEA